MKVDESYWNFGKRPHELKKYWLEKANIPTHEDDPARYLGIESIQKPARGILDSASKQGTKAISYKLIKK